MLRKSGLTSLLLVIALSAIFAIAAEAGTWTKIANSPPTSFSGCQLLTDGTVMCANGGNAWYKLTPDSHGSYVNGTWSQLASMVDTRLYNSTVVLPNGNLYIAGGEDGTGGSDARAEIYNPVTDTWTFSSTMPFTATDAESILLPNGDVLQSNSQSTFAEYDPITNSWSSTIAGPDTNETDWVKLPDDSILEIVSYGQNTSRFIPSLNAWVADGTLPVALFGWGEELGSGHLLPNGNVFWIGGTSNTAIYTPSGNTNPGSWGAGPQIPGGNGAIDAPAAMMVDGNILCAVGTTSGWGSATYFYEYNYLTNSFTQVNAPNGSTSDTCAPYTTSMLDLPDGTVLYQGTGLYVYTPSGSPISAGQPSISSVSRNSDGSYTLTGAGLNGISQGAKYGDDKQMNTNFPIVRLTNSSTGNVYYGRTYNWSSTSVMTGAKLLSTSFTVPSNLPNGTYSLVEVANGNASTPITFVYPSTAAPANLTATGGANQVSLSWSAVTNATSYNLYRGTSAGGEGATPIATGLTGTSYTDTAVTNGTKYYYTVAAVNPGGTSAMSNEASATPGSTIPVTPTGLAITAGDAQLTLTWNAGAGADTYNVYRSLTSGGEGATPYQSGITGTTYTDTGLTNGTKYYYTVAAVNSLGTSGQSTEAFGIPTATVATSGPASIDCGGGAASPFVADADFSGGTTGSTTSTVATPFVSSPIPPQAVLQSWRTGVCTYTLPGFAAGTSANVILYFMDPTSTANGQRNFNVSINGAQVLTNFDVFAAAQGQLRAIQENFSTSVDSSGQVVISFNNGTAGSPIIEGISVSGTSGGPTVPSTPAGVTASAGNGQVSLSWSASSGATSYNIFRSTTSGGEGSTPVASGITSTNYTNTGLTNGTKYYFTVAAVNSAGTSAQSTEVSATPITTPPTPTGLSAAGGNAQVSLTWNASSTATSYNVYRSTTSGGEGSTPIASNVTSTSYTDTGLVNGTTYYYTVAAVNGAGISAQSTEAGASPRLPLPGTPTNLAAAGGNTQVSLSWTAGTNASTYNVYRSTTSGGEGSTPVATGISSTSYTDTGLTNGTTYYYTVASVNSTGTSAQSSEASATPVSGTSGVASINCGGSASSPFVADTDFSGGTTGSTSTTIATPFVSTPIPPQAVLDSWRTGLFTYTLGGFTAGTAHTVELYFMDPTSTANGQRNFNVSINGSQVLTNFDVYAAAQGQYRAIQENFNASANASGQIVISFTAGTSGQPIVEGISVPN